MDAATIAALEPAVLRAVIPSYLSGYVDEPGARARNLERMTAFVATVSDDALRTLVHRLAEIGSEDKMYRADPTARRLSRTWNVDLLPDVHLVGAEHLRTGRPTAVLCNHRSYYDTQATDSALAWNGFVDMADRLVAVAGPKVYADLFRRFAAACLHTLPAPQSTSLQGTEALSPRELARRALETIRLAHDAVAAGDVLLLYPEGSRTRTGRLRPFLKGVHRYLEVEGLVVVPAAVTGTDHVLPIDGEKMRPAPVSVTFGAPIDVAAAGGPRDALQAAHAAIAGLLPPDQRPADGDPAVV